MEARAKLHADFRAWKDAYFELDSDARLEVRLERDDESLPFTDDQLQYMRLVYRPKDGDYENLLRAAESLAESSQSFGSWELIKEDYPHIDVLIFLQLPNGALALIDLSESTFDAI